MIDISTIMYSNTSYKYTKYFFEENEGFDKRVSGGSKRYLSSSAFEKFPEVFNEKGNTEKEYKIIGRKNNKRIYLYIKKKYINPPENCNNYKVFMSSSNGSGELGETLTPPFVGEPNEGATETFISFGNFKTKEQALNMCKYIKTKFLRLLLNTKKVTQGNKNQNVWKNIPLQDFTKKSDIDWSKTISEIDKQLYKKYNINKIESEYIEMTIKSME